MASPQPEERAMPSTVEITDLNPHWLAAVRARPTASGATPRVLVVHAERTLRELLKLHLVTAGYAASVAEDAADAANEVMRRPPDLIVLDMTMPHMDGMEFVSALKDDAPASLIPVLFLTADERAMARAERLGAVACLTAPIYPDVFLDAVSRCLQPRADARCSAGVRPARPAQAA